MTLNCVSPVGGGEWAAILVDRATGAELPLETEGWRGSMGRAKNAVSQSSVVLDARYALALGRTPIPWDNELVLTRDGELAWVGPITSVDDSDPEGVTWAAQDRMAWAMLRRPWWRTHTMTAEVTRLFELALNSADFGDPIGLRRDPRPVGVVTSISPVAGDPVGDSIDQLSQALEWTVVGDVVRFGRIEISADATLPADAWAEDRPSLRQDGLERLSHVVAITENNGRVWYPSADPDDRPPGVPLLVDSIDVGDITPAQARLVARALWQSRQGGLFVVNDAERPINLNFPLGWRQMIPGATLDSSVRGRALFADQVPMALATLTVDIADSKELAVNPGMEEASGIGTGDLNRFLAQLPGLGGTVVPDTAVFPFDVDPRWNDVVNPDDNSGDPLTDDPFGGDDPFFDDPWDPNNDGPEVDPYDPFGGDDPFDDNWPGGDGPDPVWDPPPDYDPGGDVPDVHPFDPFNDPFADCPPAICCTLCSTGGGGGGDRRIWLSTDLAPGQDVWVARDGSIAQLHPDVAATLADPGFNVGGQEGMDLYLMDQAVTSGQLPAGDTVTVELDVTAPWTYSGPRTDGPFQFAYRSNPGQALFVRPQGFHDTFIPNPNPPPDPTTIGLSDLIAYQSVPFDPAAEGVTGYARAYFRMRHNPNTGLCEAWMGPDAQSLVFKGSMTIATGRQDWYTWLFNPSGAHDIPDFPSIGQRCVVHAGSLETSSLGTVFSFTQADIEGLPVTYSVGEDYWQHHLFGNNARAGSNAISNPSAFNGAEFAASPAGSPAYLWDAGANTPTPSLPALFTGGTPLGDPIIACSNHYEPTRIQLVEAQPSDFAGVVEQGGFDDRSCFVWAVADRSTFSEAELDANGWPTNYWPLGPRRS